MINDLDFASEKDLFELVVGRSERHLLKDIEISSIYGKDHILIIGAGGSIGSALARRLAKANIKNLFFLDRDESALHALALDLSNMAASNSDNYFVADIRDRQSVKDVIEQVKPTIVIHAAALKHLVILERFPREGFLTNIIGTLNVAEICVEYRVSQFVNISTDKAAYPTSVLGKTKKISELLVEEVFANSGLNQCSVRFGNVFASRGSVIETFIHQIKNNIPVTLSEINVARFFMSRNEAANLILASASLKVNGTYTQNMGEEVLIIDIVKRIAKYLDKNPEIKIVGLKRGEKLREDLYDGPISATKFDSISRSLYLPTQDLVNNIRKVDVSNNLKALEAIKKLLPSNLLEKSS